MSHNVQIVDDRATMRRSIASALRPADVAVEIAACRGGPTGAAASITILADAILADLEPTTLGVAEPAGGAESGRPEQSTGFSLP